MPGTNQWQRVYPIGSSRPPAPPEVPATIALDYAEACSVLPLSPKASAALSRRCLQNILHEHGYNARDLAKEIDLVLNETDTAKVIPTAIRTTIDAIRNLGNFSAHPITETTSLQILDVDPGEAEWCLEILDVLFDQYYVQPAHAATRKAQLNEKLAAAGKPPSR